MLRVFVLVFVALLPISSLAQSLPAIQERPDGLQPLETMDDVRPFAAVGRLDTGTGFCTATLITTELVLTAAHCLFDAETGERRPDGALIFSAGLRHERVTAQRGVQASFVHPDYDFGAPSDPARVRSDIALLRLERPISLSTIIPLNVGGRAFQGDEVHVVSYGRDRAEYASLEEGCDVVARQSGVHVLSCSVVNGSSGSPVMIAIPGGYRITSVVSAMAQWRSDPVALAAGLHGEIDQLMLMAGSRAAGLPAAELPQVRTLSAGTGAREVSGARFLRP